jgi:hypothetical protein
VTTAVAGSVHRSAPPGLRASLREFTTFRSARWLAAMVAGSAGVRLLLGGLGVRDLVVAAALVGVQPFTEWLIHVFILHWRPREIFGRVRDPWVARSHRRHHQAPKDPRFIFIAMPAIKGYAVLDVVLLVLAWRLSASIATAVAVANSLALLYEWTHWLIHTDYQPRSRLYRGLWRAHRLHHFRNENYWYGVTGHLGDRVLRTYPAKEDVPLSPTATTLGVTM